MPSQRRLRCARRRGAMLAGAEAKRKRRKEKAACRRPKIAARRHPHKSVTLPFRTAARYLFKNSGLRELRRGCGTGRKTSRSARGCLPTRPPQPSHHPQFPSPPPHPSPSSFPSRHPPPSFPPPSDPTPPSAATPARALSLNATPPPKPIPPGAPTPADLAPRRPPRHQSRFPPRGSPCLTPPA
jgi:hypothetical protein